MTNAIRFDIPPRDKVIRTVPGLFRRELPYRVVSVISGALLGLSAPGLDQWYIAWFGLVPLIALSLTAKEPWLAGVRGWYFATAYNLVYLSWYLFLRPLFAACTFDACPGFVNFFCWTTQAAWQGLFVSIFACVIKAIPLTGGWLPNRHQGRWHLPVFVVLPFLWVLIDKMCNAPQLLGVPWSALEYSQYKQLPIIQAASLIGGVGIGACIVLANVAILGIFASRLPSLQALAYRSRTALILNTLVAVALLLALPAFGVMRLKSEERADKNKISITAVQANLAPVVHNVSGTKIMTEYVELCKRSPVGSLCIWPEWALDLDFSKETEVLRILAQIPAHRKQNWVIGTFDIDDQERKYNAVCAMDDSGKLRNEVYHKIYPVPFGELTPDWVRESPLGLLRSGVDKNYKDTTPGTKPVVFKLKNANVGPMICFECVMPNLSVDCVRKGAQILVDCSNTSWYYKSIMSDQMIAFCTMRAAENHRSFVFSTGLGPSVIIDSVGRTLRQAPREEAATISADVPVESDVTPFTRFFF